MLKWFFLPSWKSWKGLCCRSRGLGCRLTVSVAGSQILVTRAFLPFLILAPGNEQQRPQQICARYELWVGEREREEREHLLSVNPAYFSCPKHLMCFALLRLFLGLFVAPNNATRVAVNFQFLFGELELNKQLPKKEAISCPKYGAHVGISNNFDLFQSAQIFLHTLCTCKEFSGELSLFTIYNPLFHLVRGMM